MKKKAEMEIKEETTLEELFAELDRVLTDMDDDKVSLEAAFTLYQKGITLVKRCNEKIDHVEKEIRILNEAGGEEAEYGI